MLGDKKKTWEEQMKETADQIINRKPFEYDMNADKLYQQYKDAYTNQGKMAMEDTVGQASALTGGYGNSYAVTAGNQAYMGYMKELDNIAPSLYQAAMDRYVAEGDALNDKYDALAKLLGESTEDPEGFLGEDDIFTSYAEKLKNGKIESNDALADFLAKELMAGNIDDTEADKLYDYFIDLNEKTTKDEENNTVLSYRRMIRSAYNDEAGAGWSYKDGKFQTPMGFSLSEDELINLLIQEGGVRDQSEKDYKKQVERAVKSLKEKLS
jgi:hypothetical protein